MNKRVPGARIGLMFVLAGLPSCAAAQPEAEPTAVPAPLPHEPAVADFAEGDRDAVAAMLREVPTRFRSPYALLPGARAVTILLTCRVESVHPGDSFHAGVVGVTCLSAGTQLGLAVDERTQLYETSSWAQKEFGVSAGALTVGEVRTLVVHGSGFGGELWKRFLVFAGPAR